MKTKIIKISRFIGVTAALSLLVLTGFGCKGLSAQQKAATAPITLEFWTVFEDVDAINKIAETYTVNRKFIKINVRKLRSDEIYNRFVEALADDKGPDIISVNSRNLGKYLSRLQPMPATIKDTNLIITKGKFSESQEVFTGVLPMVDMVKLKAEFVQTVYADAVRDKKIYGLPLSLDTMALYYNKDLLDRAGIPEPPKTWEEFQSQVKQLVKFDKASGKILQAGAALGTGANIPASSDILYILFTQSKIPFTNEIGYASFDRKPQNYSGGELPGEQIVNFYTDFANPTRDTYTWNDTMPNALDSFVNGQTAFFFGYSYQFPIIKSRAPQLNFAVTPMLQLSPDQKVNTANYWLQTVPTKSKHSNEAWGFINYLAYSKGNKPYLDATGRPTALRAHIAEQALKPDLSPFISQLLVAGNWYRGYDYDAAEKAVQMMFAEWLKPIGENEEVAKIHKDALERAAAKVNQTMVAPKNSL